MTIAAILSYSSAQNGNHEIIVLPDVGSSNTSFRQEGLPPAPGAAGSLLEHRLWAVTQPAFVEEMKTLVEGNNAFALQLYGKLRSTEGNLVLSPYSNWKTA